MGRRDLLRVESKLEVEYKSFDQFSQEYTKNICLGGIFIKTNQMLPVQTVLEIALKLPDRAEAISLVGEVVHALDPKVAKAHGWEPGLGINFVDFEEYGKEILAQYMREISEKQPQARIPDRRKSERVPLRLRVKFHNLQTLMQDYSRDIGQGGIFIQTAHPRGLGERFTISLVHPENKQELELEGEVVRVSRKEPRDPESVSGMGIRFINLNEKTKQAINLFLAVDFPRER